MKTSYEMTCVCVTGGIVQYSGPETVIVEQPGRACIWEVFS